MRFAHHCWSQALAAGLLLAGCKSNKDAEPAPDKAQATAPAPKPAAPAPAPTLAPVSDATLSYLEQSPGPKCRWVQHTPPGEPKTVFTFPSYCSLTLSWKPDGREALVSRREWTRYEIWRVDLATGQSTPLSSLPSRGTFGTIGFDRQGRTVAIMEERYEEGSDTPPTLKVVETDTGEGTKKQFLFEGQRYDLSTDGYFAGLAHAFRLDKGGTWRRFETKSASYDSEDSSGFLVLDALHAMAPTSNNSLGTSTLQDVPEDSPDFAELIAVRAPEDIGGWKQLETAAGPLYLYIWHDPSQDPEWHTSLARIRGETGLVEPEGLSFTGELVEVDMRGDLVLLRSSERSGALARLWNAKTKKLVTSLAKKDRLTFWPKPSKTPAAAQSSRE